MPRSTDRRYRVLVVDDDVYVREVLEECLVDEGHEVRTAADGVEALRVAGELVPDVIFLDLRMPRMGGEELLRHYPASLPPPAVIVLSASSAPRVPQAATLLLKPFSIDELLDAMQRALAQPPGERAAR